MKKRRNIAPKMKDNLNLPGLFKISKILFQRMLFPKTSKHKNSKTWYNFIFSYRGARAKSGLFALSVSTTQFIANSVNNSVATDRVIIFLWEKGTDIWCVFAKI